jgi:hypothetical protein
MLNFKIKNLSKVFVLALFFFVFSNFFLVPIQSVHAQTNTYQLLEPLPCEPGTPNCTQDKSGDYTISSYDVSDGDIGKYINIMIKIVIGLAAVLAVVMIVMGGMEYMTSELISSKESGKSKMTNAILGLIIALGAYALLYTINPDILRTKIPIEKIAVEYTPRAQVIAGRLGKGKCEPITDESNYCSPAKLTGAFGASATQASSICNGESRGNYLSGSGVDRTSDNLPFSIGLFQINIIAHGKDIGDGKICSNIFQVDPNPPGKVRASANDSTLGGCLELDNGVCVKYAAKVIDRAKYDACIAFVAEPAENIKFAAKLQTSRGWGQWGFNASCHF